MIILSRTYKQTRPTSCGPSCLLMAINCLQEGLVDLTEEAEAKIHDEIGYKELDMYTMPAALCKYLLTRDFKIKYYFYNNADEHHDLIDSCFSADALIRATLAAYPHFELHTGNFSNSVIDQELGKDRLGFVPIKRLGDGGDLRPGEIQE